MGVTALNVVKRSAKGISSLYQRRPAAGMAVGLACVAALVFAAYTLWPNGDYRPIQKGEKWTAGEAVAKAKDIPSGRPGLTEELEEELGGAPPVADEAIPDESTGTGEETSSETEPTPEPSATSGSGESESNASPSPEASP
jgi:hypothetical protein